MAALSSCQLLNREGMPSSADSALAFSSVPRLINTKPRPLEHADSVQREVGRVEIIRWQPPGRSQQIAIEGVGPSMVGAHDGLVMKRALVLLTENRSAMAAGVVKPM